MTFEKFVETVKERIRDYLPEEYADSQVRAQENLKNNGVKLTGLIILEKGKNVAPTIYLEPYYKMSDYGEQLEETMQQIASIYKKYQEETPPFQLDKFNYENIKDKLFVSVINAEKNEELLQDIPHERKEDLALVYKVKMGLCEGGPIGSVLLHNDHLKTLNISVTELSEQAMSSMKELMPYEFFGMNSLIEELMQPMIPGEDELVPENMDNDLMYVLTNSQKLYGAAYMFDEKVMAEISEKLGGNFAVLPSSIHEIIILRETQDLDFEQLRDMVKEINATQLAEEEILSDSVYFYDAEQQKLSIVDDAAQVQGMNMGM